MFVVIVTIEATLVGLRGKELALMSRRLLVSTGALIIALMMGITAGPAWGQHHGGDCTDYEGDHGSGCLPTAQDECQEGGWQPFDVLKNLFNNQPLCI